MLMSREYLRDMQEHIKGMDERDLIQRGTMKEKVLNDEDIMNRLWAVYQKDVQDYECDRDFSMDDAVNEVLGPLPTLVDVENAPKASSLYRCPFCGSERFIGHQILRADIYVGGDGEFEENLPGGLEANVYDSGHPYGPFTCSQCREEFDELPENKQVRLPRGTFTVISGETVRKCKEKGYGYSHEDNGYTVVGNGTRAIAASNQDYNRYYGGQRSFML